MNTKQCPRCNEVKSLDSFAKNAKRKDGLAAYCRVCNKAYQQLWYQRNREKKLAQNAEWRAENKEHLAALVKQWSQANPEKRRESNKRSYDKNPQKYIAKSIQWRNKNPERARELVRQSRARHIDARRESGRQRYALYRDTLLEKSRKYREQRREELAQRTKSWRQENPAKARAASLVKKARKRAATVGDKQKLAQFIEWAYITAEIDCEYCASTTTPDSRHLDHIQPLARGGAHAVWNLCVACPPCNMAKHTMTGVEFRQRMAAQ